MAKRTRPWTNKSVVGFAAGADPIAAMLRTARDGVIEAIEQGWEGPPFDLTELATRRGLEVIPSDDVKDARTVKVGGVLRIEYNPNRPARRVRYSIAHEIAHTLFPDCDEQVRHRQTAERGKGDEWQLEALCNIGAAELLMPVGSLPPVGSATLHIEQLIELRERFQVGTEAIAIRLVQLTREPCAMFCASRPPLRDGAMQVDYMIGSAAWAHPILQRQPLPENSVASHCTGVDFTWTGNEKWRVEGLPELDVEAIGIPPYPGSRYPRAVGIARPTTRDALAPSISYVRGDATEPRGDGSRLIVHVVHDATANWGGHGFANALARRHRAVQNDFRSWADEQGLGASFGTVRFCHIDETTAVASMVCQRGYRRGKQGLPLLRYRALRDCLTGVADHCVEGGMSVHMPRIGTGAAGGSWSVIEELIQSELVQRGVSVTVYELPGSRPFAEPQLSLSFART